MNSKYSIIVATFNSDKTLQSTLESLLLQNYKEFEVPFINLYKKSNYLNGNLNKKDFAVI